VKERKLKKAQIYSVWGFSIIAAGGILQLFSENNIYVYSLLLLGSGICFIALIKAIRNFK